MDVAGDSTEKSTDNSSAANPNKEATAPPPEKEKNDVTDASKANKAADAGASSATASENAADGGSRVKAASSNIPQAIRVPPRPSSAMSISSSPSSSPKPAGLKRVATLADLTAGAGTSKVTKSSASGSVVSHVGFKSEKEIGKLQRSLSRGVWTSKLPRASQARSYHR